MILHVSVLGTRKIQLEDSFTFEQLYHTILAIFQEDGPKKHAFPCHKQTKTAESLHIKGFCCFDLRFYQKECNRDLCHGKSTC
jgi:hypothetical protein